MTQEIHQPNDSLFKQAMSDIRVAKDFFLSHLPKNILEIIDLDQLQLENTSFIDEHYNQSESDVIYSTKTKDDQATYFYLLCEQQTLVDKDMPFRLLKYQVRLMDQHRKLHPKEALPIVYPIVLYSGKKLWDEPRSIFPYFGEQEQLAHSLWGEPFQMIDVHRIEENEAEKRTLSGLMEFALKNKKIQNFRAFLKKLLPWLDQVEIALGGDFGKIVLQYVLCDIDSVDRQIFVEEINQYTSSTIRRTTMTLAEQFREEGFQKGLKKGKTLAEQFREEGLKEGLKNGQTEATKAMAIKLLDNGISLEIITNITGLSAREIQTLQKEKAIT